MGYLLVRLQCRYGKVRQFEDAMSHLVPVLERKGWRLHGAYVTTIGRLNQVYDLWEMPDAAHIKSVLDVARDDPDWVKWAPALADCLEDEQLEYLELASYAH
jgi:hypothetical protein